jgi:thymidylate synthase ThyX
MVLILENGAIITPEDEAMLQALHSRSAEGVASHLEKLAKAGSGKFMESFYVGYGHKSIGDCGTITLFIEGISMLAAKAIQDSMLYSGQEASTRYIDFSNQPFLDPIGNDVSRSILARLRSFYVGASERVVAHLKEQFPKKDDEMQGTYDKAINARSFDILRGALPAGATTNIAWHTNLRQAADRIALLRHHPCHEIRDIAVAIETALRRKYPNSFGHKTYESTETYNREWMTGEYLFDPEKDAFPDMALAFDGIDRARLGEHRDLLLRRPAKTELPKLVGDSGTVRFEFLLDFGSFRDVQRHRAVVQRMPLLTAKFGFVPWYLESMPEEVRLEAKALLAEIESSLNRLSEDFPKETLQYYVPMGYAVPVSLTGDIAAFAYLIELRATPFVHPTLQKRALEMATILEGRFGDSGLRLHVDHGALGRFDTKRGNHDIVKK